MLPLRIESQYFGSVQYIKQIATANSAVIDIHEPFKKMSYRNRTTIVSAQGPLLLTVPLQNGRDQKRPIHEVKISYTENWQSKHLKALSSCYKRSPFFEYYEDGLSQLLHKEYPYLLDLNIHTVEWLSKVLKTEFNISKTTIIVYISEKYPVVFENRIGILGTLKVTVLPVFENNEV